MRVSCLEPINHFFSGLFRCCIADDKEIAVASLVCGKAQNRRCEEAMETDLTAVSLFLSTEGTLSPRLPSSPEVGAQGPRTVARRF